MPKVNIVGKIPEVDYHVYNDLLDCPRLFKSINDDFTTPGIPLRDALTCQVTWNANQFPILQMTYPRDGVHMSEIEENRYILADVNRKFVHQIFKITHTQNVLDNVVVDAEHIAATLNDATVPSDIQFASGSAQDLMNQVLNTMQPPKGFNFDSEVSSIQNVNVQGGQQAGAILIDPDQEGDTATQSVLGLFGGELEFDNFDIHHSKHAGNDSGIVVAYGKNVQSITQDRNIENMYTGAVFTATYTPGQAIATETNVDWNNWPTIYSNVAKTYLAGGSVSIYDSPVEGQHQIATLKNGQKIHLGQVVADQSFTPDGKFQINTVNSDTWYPIAPEDGGGWIDANWLNFDATGTYLVTNVQGHVTVKAADPHDESGAGSRVSISGYAVVAYKKGSSIHGYYSPEIGETHYRNGKTYKNGQRIHYDMVERNQNGDLWYRVSSHNWLYGPHLSLSQDGSHQSFSNSGWGYLTDKAVIYHMNKKHEMVATTKTANVTSKSKKAYRYVGKGKNRHKVANKSYWKEKQKKVKVKAKEGMATIDKTIVQGGVTYHHTKYGWVRSSSISYKKDGSVKPQFSASSYLKSQIKDHSKVEIYATPDKTQALNWSIPNGESFDIVDGHEAKGGDGKTYVQVTYHGKTGWLPEDNIDSDKSKLDAPDSSDNAPENSTASVDQSQKEVKVVVGPLYADGYGIDPNIDKVNTVDISSYFKHDDQDLSGQQDDGSFVATQADIEQATQIGTNYLIEHKYGHPQISCTVGYQEMSGIHADFTQLSMYDYVTVFFPKYGIQEQAEVNATVWDCLAQHYSSVTIGDLPETYEHLLLQAADKKSNERVSGATNSLKGHMNGLLNQYDYMLKQEGSSRKEAERKLMDNLGLVEHRVNKNGKDIATQLVTNKNFEERMNSIQATAQEMKDWVTNGSSGVIKAVPNWQNPTMLTATTGNGGRMAFTGNGLVFYDEYGNERPRAGMDSLGQVYADCIKAGTIEAVNIKSCLVESALKIGKQNGMNIYIGTEQPSGTNLTPDNGGNVIWLTSPSYSSMLSSGQLAVSDNGWQRTEIRPSGITVGGAVVLRADNWDTPLSNGQHLISSGSQYTNLTDFIKAHFSSKYYHGL